MEYNEILDKLAKLERNLIRANHRGDTAKSKKYKNDINDLHQRKKKIEMGDMTGTITKQDDKIKSLNEEIVSLKETNVKLYGEIENLKTRMNQILTPLAENQPEPEPAKQNCPKCGQPVLETEMAEHQESCKSSRQ